MGRASNSPERICSNVASCGGVGTDAPSLTMDLHSAKACSYCVRQTRPWMRMFVPIDRQAFVIPRGGEMMTAPVLSSTAKSRSSARHSDRTVALKANSVPTSPFCRAVESSAAVVRTAKTMGATIMISELYQTSRCCAFPHVRVWSARFTKRI